MAVTEEVIVKLGLEIDDNGQVKNVTAGLGKLGKAIKKSDEQGVVLKKRWQGLAIELTGLNSVLELGKKAFNALSGSVNAVIDPFVEFENALVAVQKTANLSEGVAKNFGNRMQDLSEQIPASATELLNLAAAAGQLGVTGEDNLANFAETMAKVAVASDLAGEEGAKSLVRILNATKEPIDKVDEFASVIVKLGNSVAASESEIARMTTEIARSIGVFGASSAESAGLGAAMREVGIQAALGGSVVGKSMRTIEAAIRNGGAELDILTQLTGMTGDQLKKTFKEDAVGVFTSFVEGLGGVNEAGGSVSAVLESIGLSGDEVNKVLPTLATNADKVRDRIKLATDEFGNATALNIEAANAFKTLDSAMKTTGNALTNLASDIGETLKPVAIAVLKVVRDLAVGLRSSFEGMRAFIKSIDFESVLQTTAALTIALTGLFAVMKAGVIKTAALALATKGLAAAKVIALAATTKLRLGLASLALQTALAGGGFIGLVKVVGSYALVAAKAAIASALIVAKFVLIGVAIVAIVAAIDILIRNFNKLGQLGDLIQNSLGAVFVKLAQLFASLKTKFFQFVQDVVMKMNELGLASTEAVENAIRNTSQALSEEIELIGVQQAAAEAVKKSAEGIDFGFAGKGIAAFKDAIASAKVDTKETAEDTKKAGDSAGGLAINLGAASQKAKELMDTLKGIGDQNASLKLAISNIGATQEAQLSNQLRFDVARVDQKIKELEVQKKITPEIRAALETQKKLLGDKAVLEAGEMAKKRLKEQMALTKGLVSQNAGLATEILNSGQKQSVQIKNNLKLELARLEAKRSQLKAEGKLTAEADRQLDVQAKLLKQKAGGAIKEAEKKEAEKDDKEGIGIGAVAGAIGGFVGAIASMLDPANIEGIIDKINNVILKLPELMIKAFNGLIKAMDKLIEKLPEIASKILGALPTIFSKLAEQAPKLMTAIMDAVGQLFEMLPQILAPIIESISDVFGSLLKGLPRIITGIFDAIPQLIDMILKEIPEVLITLFENLPDIIESIVEGIMSAIPQIIVSVIDFFIEGLPGIVAAFIKMIPRIVVAIVRGIINGLAKGLGKVFGNIKAPKFIDDIGKKFNEGVKQLSKSAAAVGSQVFKVLDLEAEGKGFEKAKNVENVINKAIKGINASQSKFIKALRAIWKWINDKILQPIVKAFKTLWKFVKEKIFAPIISAFQLLWEFVKGFFDAIIIAFQAIWDFVKMIFDAYINSLRAVYTFIWESILKPSVEMLREAWNIIWQNIIQPMISGLQAVWNFVKELNDKYIAAVTGVFMWIKENIVDKFASGISAVFTWFKENVVDKFADGVKAVFVKVKEDFDKVVTAFKAAFLKVKEDFDKVVTAFKDAFAKIKEEFDKITGALSGVGKKIWDGFKTAFDGASSAIKGIGTNIWNGLKAGLDKAGDTFKGFGTKIWDGLKTGLGGIGAKIKEQIDAISPANLFKKMFKLPDSAFGKGAVEKVIGLDVPFVKFSQGGEVGGRARFKGDNPKNDSVAALLSPGEIVIPRSVVENPVLKEIALALAGGTIKRLFGGSVSVGGHSISVSSDKGVSVKKGDGKVGGVAGSVIKGDLSGAGGQIKGLKALDPKTEIMKHIKEAIRKMMRLHSGGFVPFANGGEVPAILQSGEFVIQRPAAAQLGSNALNKLNRGQMPMTINQDIQVDMRVDVSAENLDSSFVRERLIPAVKDALREASQRGELLINERGVFST